MLALKGWNTSKSRRTQTMLLPAESLKLTAVSSLTGSRGLRNMEALMLFAIESHSSSQRPCPNQAMQPTGWRCAMTSSQHVYEIRQWRDKRGVDLISDASMWYGVKIENYR